MSSQKKNRETASQRLTRERRPSERRNRRAAPSDTRLVRPEIHREIRHITQLALSGDSRIVTLGNLVLFSTPTRDAWLLDPEDALAACLCREGEPQPVRIIDAPETFAIEWTARFAIEGPLFIIRERSGRVLMKHGYPTRGIAAACRDGSASNDPLVHRPLMDPDSGSRRNE